MNIKIGIVGYGNLGKGAEQAVAASPDMELAAVFTRRESGVATESGVPAVHMSKLADYIGKIDVMLLCGGSATDLPEQTPAIVKFFNVVDSFDTHANIPQHFAAVDAAAKTAGTVGLISCGWDPGLFSLNRLLGSCVLPEGHEYTFWGKGVSQGHSDAIRRIDGVQNAVQYTVPVPEALEAVRAGREPELTARQKHTRLCYVVAKDGADTAAIEKAIVTMPNYFADYDTTVHFIDETAFKRDHSAMPHGGHVIRSGMTGDGTRQRMEFSLELGSNPAFTGSVLAAYARAAFRLGAEGKTGAFSVFDVPFSYLSDKTSAELLAEML